MIWPSTNSIVADFCREADAVSTGLYFSSNIAFLHIFLHSLVSAQAVERATNLLRSVKCSGHGEGNKLTKVIRI